MCIRGFNRRLINGRLPFAVRSYSSTRGSGFCMCRRGFNRRLINCYFTPENKPSQSPGALPFSPSFTSKVTL